MARVFIPASIRSLAGGQEVVDVPASSVREAMKVLEQKFPGISEYLCQDGELRRGWCVAVEGSVSSMGLLAKVSDESEIHFLPLVGGG